MVWSLLRSQTQLCCSVLDSIGGAESYNVSVSCVGSPANVHEFDNVPAPQSQKNLWSKDITQVTQKTREPASPFQNYSVIEVTKLKS